MYKYLAVTNNHTGEWISGPSNDLYVFEAENDEAARTIICSHHSRISFLGRITGGLQVEEVCVPYAGDSRSIGLSKERKRLSYEQQQDIGFEHVYDERLVAQLQPFDPKVREDRLAELEKERCKKKEVPMVGNIPGTPEQIEAEVKEHAKKCGCSFPYSWYRDLRTHGFQPWECVIEGCRLFIDDQKAGEKKWKSFWRKRKLLSPQS